MVTASLYTEIYAMQLCYGVCGRDRINDAVSKLTTTHNKSAAISRHSVPGCMPVIDVLNKLLYDPLHIGAIFLEQLLVAAPVSEAHLNQLLHWSTRLHGYGVDSGDRWRPWWRGSPVVLWRYPDRLYRSPVGLWRCPV